MAFQKKREKSHLDDHRVAEVAQKREGPSPKSLNSDENFKPWHMLFCCDCDIKIYRDLHAIWKTLGKKMFVFFWGGGGHKQCFLGRKCTITWYILHISY